MKTKRENISKALESYIPTCYVPYVVDLMFSQKLNFRISKPRKTKAGDYRPPFNGKPHRISVNSDLNPYAFLITTIHEFAHMTTYIKYGGYVSPHGKEWKSEFKRLLIPVLEKKELPESIEQALLKSLNNLKASSCTDIHLTRALMAFNEKKEGTALVEELENNSYFKLGKMVFQRGILRRRKYLCTEVKTGKKYLVNRLAEVKPLNEEK
ncbi:SprT-like domain-containing protein [Brumimicrobium aurantiacum]|uniref:SprT domain-containing protein n=1 Tax=Brumimicrobium aurantiacum TaxID=1737063 RepID=A0A3E1EVM3_9FLAO|nr:SprT-like domain-containing protein [Brumimicrobium aurantiacum]RFC53597.1 sprT domain-containing protein [Brumimicrobium aurantiacum]